MYNERTLIEQLILREDIPWAVGSPELADAIKAHEKAQSVVYDAATAVEDADFALHVAEAEWDKNSVEHFDKTGKLLSKDEVKLAEIALQSAERKQAVAKAKVNEAFGAIFGIIMAPGFIDKWRENLYPEIEQRQKRLAKVASDIVTDVISTELMLGLAEWLGVFPNKLPELPAPGSAVADLLGLASRQAWLKPVPENTISEVVYQHEIPEDTRPDVWIVANGNTEEVSAATFDEMLGNVNLRFRPRLATDSEIAKAKRQS